VTAVNFDYRALDTLGEEFILFTSVVGLAVLLRDQRAERERPPALTPGGGFQGGVVGAAALLMVFLGGGYLAMRRLSARASGACRVNGRGRLRADRSWWPDVRRRVLQELP
jgi:multisubunit Na+/H+ antiporter MnhB subunit